MSVIAQARRWDRQPYGDVCQSRRFPDAQIFLPGNAYTLCGGYSITPTTNGRLRAGPAGMSMHSNGTFAIGWSLSASGGDWDAGVIVANALDTSTTKFALRNGSGNGVRVMPATMVLRASSGDRLTTGVGNSPGDCVAFIGQTGAYRAIQAGRVFESTTLSGNILIAELAVGTNTDVALFARFPDWGDERLDDLLEIQRDPWGTLFEPRRVLVPVGGLAPALPPLTALARTNPRRPRYEIG
jgi:hypothetical protein